MTFLNLYKNRELGDKKLQKYLKLYSNYEFCQNVHRLEDYETYEVIDFGYFPVFSSASSHSFCRFCNKAEPLNFSEWFSKNIK
tara:strand:- start:270 stop:518 length:249 start_codon:yes stop_codon:yes gene_type:complete